MTPRAEQVVLDYLSEVGQATYGYLTARQRAVYLTELRARIDEACGDSTEAEQVRRVLEDFGTPEDLVARECAEDSADRERDGDGDAEENGNGAASRKVNREPPPWRDGPEPGAAPRHADREPPPWRGGPDRGLFGGAGRTAVRDRAGDTPRGAVVALAAAARQYPPEMFAIGVYLVSGLVGQVALVWVVGAVLVILSDVWTRRDKRVAVAVPLAVTVISMTFWSGEAPYIDQIILMSLMETGVVGLRAAALGCVIYLLVRITRIKRATDI
ncbi:hypothetical protein F4561_004915 [Lipingzhangella halophila]|uniref:Uncharacterized protein n=1 Tax=Lipingzhangella halophila TaxID=1783352 RepID=A0A7W7W5S1_9ACTN|nr:hypothetical protein [Lipingzhangella halophila]MBB4934095.1 hypothetical protein [Lipingzhangella halophila]